MDEEIRQQFKAVISRLDAIVTRMDEQDQSHDRLMGKVDRLFVKVDQLGVLASAGEEAMTSFDALSRRVAKIEAAMRGKEE
jgi:phage shock protein A